MAAPVQITITANDMASAALGKIGNSLDGLASKAASAGSIAQNAIGVALGGGISMLAGKFMEGASAGMNFNSSMEQVTAKLNAFTKDGAKSAEILDMIKKRAASTPFAFEEMAQATTALLPASKASGVALEDLIGTAEIMAALNPAQGLEGAAIALRAATSGDFVSAMERFDIPRDIINRLKEEGVPNSQIVGRALKEMGMDATLVTNMAGTMSGKWSTFQDTLVSLAAKASEPLFEKLSEGLGGLQTMLDANMPMLEGLADVVGNGLGAAFDFISSTVIPAMVAGWNTLQVAIQPIISVFQALFSGDFGLAADEMAESLAGMIPEGMIPLARDFSNALMSVVHILADLPVYIQTGMAQGDVMGFILQWKDQALVHLQALGTSMLAWVSAQLPVITGQLATWAGAFKDWVTDALPPLLAQLQALTAQVMAFVQAQVPVLLGQLLVWGKQLWAWVEPQLGPLMEQLGGLVVTMIEFLAGQASVILENLAVWGAQFLEWIGPRIGPMLEELGIMAERFLQWIVSVAAPAIAEKLVVWAEKFSEWAAGVWEKMKPKIEAFATSIGDWLKDTAAPAIGKKAAEIGQEVVNGIIAGVDKIKGNLSKKIKEVADALPQWLREWWGITSPSKVFMSIGEYAMLGLEIGIARGFEPVREYAERNFTGLYERMQEITKVGVEEVTGALTPLDLLPGKVATVANQIVTSFKTNLDMLPGQTALIMDATASSTLTNMDMLPGQIAAIGSDIPTTVADGITSNADRMRDAADALISSTAITATNTQHEHRGDYVGVGASMVDGVREGVTRNADYLMSQMRDMAARALQAAKDVLGIRSPSKVMEQQVGAPLIQGLIAGIDGGAAELIVTTQDAITLMLQESRATLENEAMLMADSMKGAIVSKASEAKNDAIAHIQGIIAGLRGEKDNFHGTGQTLGEALRDGVMAGLSGLRAALLAEINGAIQAAREAARNARGNGGGGTPAPGGNTPYNGTRGDDYTGYGGNREGNSYTVVYNSAPPPTDYDFTALRATVE